MHAGANLINHGIGKMMFFTPQHGSMALLITLQLITVVIQRCHSSMINITKTLCNNNYHPKIHHLQFQNLTSHDDKQVSVRQVLLQIQDRRTSVGYIAKTPNQFTTSQTTQNISKALTAIDFEIPCVSRDKQTKKSNSTCNRRPTFSRPFTWTIHFESGQSKQHWRI